MCSLPRTQLEISRTSLLLLMEWGGHNAGDYASSHAVRILVDEIREDTDYNPVR